MKPRKSNKIIIILIIIFAILILAGGFAYCYLATDMFKSDKDLFFKYVSQIADEKKGFIEKELTQYYEKTSNTPYTNDGTIGFNIETNTQENYFEDINNFNISFSRKGRFSKFKINSRY